MMRRREIFTDGAFLLAGALAGPSAGAAATPQWTRSGSGASRPQLIDIQHHFLPDFYRTAMGAGRHMPEWSVQMSLDRMDRDAVSTAMLSISTPGVEDPNSPANTVRLCREVNDYGAKVVSERPKRFGLFASLPLPDIDASLKEIAYIFDDLHADGIVLMSHYGQGIYTGNPLLDPVMQELNRRRAVVFIHPHFAYYTSRSEKTPLATPQLRGMELPVDTGRAMLSMFAAGTTKAFPNIRFIAAHAGGVAMMLHSRATYAMATQMSMREAHRQVSEFLRSFYYDIALAFHPDLLRHIKNVADPDKIMFGSDFPYVAEPGIAQETVEQMRAVFGASFGAVERRNAELLFPRLGLS